MVTTAATVATAPAKRLSLSDMTHLNTGKRTRLYRMMYMYGLRNGTLMVLPYDQGLEHGPRDFFPYPPSGDPEYICRLAIDLGFSAVVFQYGIAEKYIAKFAGRIPLILKLNGKTEIPSDAQALSPLNSRVEDAVRLGADAVGYTLYVGSPRQDEDFRQFMEVRAAAEAYGMPLIVWAYPRGEAVQAKGGRDSLWAVDYAARVGAELGADIVKINFPKLAPPEERAKHPKPYNELEEDDEQRIRRVINSAVNTFVLLSGGEKGSDEEVLRKVRLAMEAGAIGMIFGRNIWQRPYDEAARLVEQIQNIMREYSRPAPEY
ncbi:MAG: fructose-bisphosphate aldolase [Armatimonadota bacterium]|nr:fructose-bisphosphate aldolase [Armatimonadota bacterium]